jgi:hypothetical protein
VVAYDAWKIAGNREGGTGDPSKVHGYKRTSILFTLPYWKVSLPHFIHVSYLGNGVENVLLRKYGKMPL